MLLPPKLPFHGPDSTNEFGIIWFDQAELGQQQYAGVEIIGADRGGKCLPLRIPGLWKNFILQSRRNLAPNLSAVGEAERRRNCFQPLDACPAHGRRVGMNALAPAEFPDTGIRRQREFCRHLTERLDAPEQIGIAHARQATIEEHRRGGQYDAAIGIVLILHGGFIADPHRSVAALAVEPRLAPLLPW